MARERVAEEGDGAISETLSSGGARSQDQPRVTATANAAYGIRRLIVQRGLGAGDKLPSERQLTAILGVSRVSVRSALKELHAVGLVDISPARGAFISSPEQSTGIQMSIRAWVETNRMSLLELIECRRAIEPVAAELAARRRSEQDLLYMREQLQEMREAIQSDEPQRFSTADSLFHGVIATASANQLFVAMLDSIEDSIRTYREAAARLGIPLLLQSLNDHTEIYDAIEAEDRDAARAAMLRHIVETTVNFHIVTREELL